MSTRQRAGLVIFLFGLTAVVAMGGQETPELFRQVRILVYLLFGAALFLWPDDKDAR